MRALVVFLHSSSVFLFRKRSLMKLARFKVAESYHSSSGRNLRRCLSGALLQKTPLISLTLWPPHDSLVWEGEGKGGGRKRPQRGGGGGIKSETFAECCIRMDRGHRVYP